MTLNLVRDFAARPARFSVLVAGALAFVLSGCTSGPVSSLTEAQKLQAQAQGALARWADTVGAAQTDQAVVLVGDLSAQVGDWEPAVGDTDKQALMAGLVEAAVSLPAPTSADGTVTWHDGTTMSVPVVSAEQAVAGIRAEAATQDCRGCVPLEITGARLTSGPAATSRGSAMVPMWQFTLDGTAVMVTRVAIADPTILTLPLWSQPPWGDSGDAPVGIPIDSATSTATGHELTVRFVGVPLPADQSCWADYMTEAVESSLAVVAIVTADLNGATGACDDVGTYRTASVALAQPLGVRTVLEVTQGRPVPVTLTP